MQSGLDLLRVLIKVSTPFRPECDRELRVDPTDTLLETFTINVQSSIVNYFHYRIVGNYCTFPAPLTSGTRRIVPTMLLPTNYHSVL